MLASFWDCKIPPKLVKVEDDPIHKVMISNILKQVQQDRVRAICTEESELRVHLTKFKQQRGVL